MSQDPPKNKLAKFLSKQTFISEWAVIKWAFQQAWEIDSRNMVFWTVLNIFGALLPVLILKVTERVVDSITAAVATETSLTTVSWQIITLTIFWIMQNSYYVIPELIAYTMQTRYSIAMQGRYARFINRVPLKKFDDKEFADHINQVGGTVNRLAYFIGGITGFLGTLVGAVGLLWIALATSWILWGIGVVTFVVIFALMENLIEHYQSHWRESEPERRKQQYYAGVLTARGYGKEVRTLGLQDFFRGRWRGLTANLTAMDLKRDVKAQRIDNIIALLRLVFSTLILAIGVWLLAQGQIQLGALVMLWQLSIHLLNSAQQLAHAYKYPLSYIPVLKQQKEIFETQFDERGLPTRGSKTITALNPQEVFKLENVSFGYVPETPVLTNISVTIERGETIALVGDNGAGKSTLIKLLLGLYAPDQGNLWFEGLSYDELTQEYLYGKMGVVFQDFKQYHFTIRENIAFGDLGRLHDDEALMRAVRRGQAEKIVQMHPKGLDAFLVGTHEELMQADRHYSKMFRAQAEWYEGGGQDGELQRAN